MHCIIIASSTDREAQSHMTAKVEKELSHKCIYFSCNTWSSIFLYFYFPIPIGIDINHVVWSMEYEHTKLNFREDWFPLFQKKLSHRYTTLCYKEKVLPCTTHQILLECNGNEQNSTSIQYCDCDILISWRSSCLFSWSFIFCSSLWLITATPKLDFSPFFHVRDCLQRVKKGLSSLLPFCRSTVQE